MHEHGQHKRSQVSPQTVVPGTSVMTCITDVPGTLVIVRRRVVWRHDGATPGRDVILDDPGSF